jgi:integrase
MPNAGGRDQRDNTPAGSPSLEVFLGEWLDSIVHSVRPRTWRRYSEYVRLHLLPTLGDRTLHALKPQEIQALYSLKITQGLSSRSVLHLHRVLHKALAHAHRWGLVTENAADLVEPPRPEPREMRALSPEEARRLLAAASGDRLEALYVLAITTGMRQGEILGLRWRDVDLQARSVRVTGSLQYVRGQGLRVSAPKTARSRRNVLISDFCAAALDRHRAQQDVERGDLDQWEDNDLVFPNRIGRPIYATNLLERSFTDLLESGSTAGSLSRPSPHSGDAPVGTRSASEGGLRNARSYEHQYHARSVLPCNADDAARSRRYV